VLKGEKTSEIPIQKSVPTKLWINQIVAEQLNISFPVKISTEADKIIK
jgi:ABC-type uncharacterized transport system substrate-binding protein